MSAQQSHAGDDPPLRLGREHTDWPRLSVPTSENVIPPYMETIRRCPSCQSRALERSPSRDPCRYCRRVWKGGELIHEPNRFDGGNQTYSSNTAGDFTVAYASDKSDGQQASFLIFGKENQERLGPQETEVASCSSPLPK